jgi:hypothetical protein
VITVELDVVGPFDRGYVCLYVFGYFDCALDCFFVWASVYQCEDFDRDFFRGWFGNQRWFWDCHVVLFIRFCGALVFAPAAVGECCFRHSNCVCRFALGHTVLHHLQCA